MNTITRTRGVLTESVKSVGTETESQYHSDFEVTMKESEMDNEKKLNPSSVHPLVGPLTGPFSTPPPAPSRVLVSPT